jgi:hypothetical protein
MKGGVGAASGAARAPRTFARFSRRAGHHDPRPALVAPLGDQLRDRDVDLAVEMLQRSALALELVPVEGAGRP